MSLDDDDSGGGYKRRPKDARDDRSRVDGDNRAQQPDALSPMNWLDRLGDRGATTEAASDQLASPPDVARPKRRLDLFEPIGKASDADNSAAVQAKGDLTGPDVQATAAHGVATAASPLPHLDRIQQSFGSHDVSHVRAQLGGPATDAAGAIGASAYATGDRVAFADPSPSLHLAAHEAAHSVQQRSGVSLKSGVGQSGDAYERHADAVADKVVAGESAQSLLDTHAGKGGGATNAVQRFDAGSGGHQGMERTIAGLDPKNGLGQPENLDKPEPGAGTREHGANAIYSGNFMQDFSQMHAPFVHELLTNLPKRPADAAQGKDSPTIGDAGSEAITDSIIRALAILDVGPTLADQVVAGNMQAYRPEQHVDQPMGYAANTDSLVHDGGPTGALRPGRKTVQGGDYLPTSPMDLGTSTNVKQVADADRDRDLAGSAAPGRQFENPELMKVSDAGLQNHIYNSVEWVKGHWLDAAKLGPTDEGRFHVGAGLHAIEDYFSHSNFIEVALNSFIGNAIDKPKGQSRGTKSLAKQVQQDQKSGVRSQQKIGDEHTLVDTLFDVSAPKVRARDKRQAITTGSVSGVDMKGSIGHILLPKAPMLQDAIDYGIEKIFGLVYAAPSHIDWKTLKAPAKTDRRMAAVLALGDGVDKAGMTLPVPVVELSWGSLEVPLPVVSNPTFEYPDGVNLTFKERPVTSAIGSYVDFAKRAREAIETLQKYIGYIKYAGPAGYAASKAMNKAIDSLKQWITDQLTLLKRRMKQQLMLGMVTLIDSISGVDTRDEKDRSIGDSLANVHDRVEMFEHQTSLEARLLPGGDLAKLSNAELEPIVGPVTPAPDGGWKATNSLAPSHSEISKDHAPYDDVHTHGHGSAARSAVDLGEEEGDLLHPDQHQEGAEHDHAEGSIFGGLARALAFEADRHVLRQVEIVWQDRGSLYGDSKALDTSTMEVGHGAINAQAGDRAKDEEKRATKAGYKFAQSDGSKMAAMAKPGVRDLMNLVDLIIAHPDDSAWWRTVVEAYVSGHADEVARHIRERNAVRGNRRMVTTQ